MKEATKKEKTSKLRSLSSKKDTKRSSKKKKKKKRRHKKNAAQADSEDAEAQAEKENAAAAGGNCENVDAKTEEVERMCAGSMMNDSEETANEAGGGTVDVLYSAQ